MFKVILRQQVAWFDEDRHSTGALATRLSNDAARVQAAVGGNLGTVLQTSSTLIAGLIIAFTASWQLALAVLATLPIVGFASMLETRSMMGMNKSSRTAFEDSGNIASETIENIRTVVSLGREQTFRDDYNTSLEGPNKAGAWQAVLNGCAYGFSQMIVFCIWVCAFFPLFLLTEWVYSVHRLARSISARG